MCHYHIIELYNASGNTPKAPGTLAPSDNTLAYNEKVAITPNTYKIFFKCPSQRSRRLAILRITYSDSNGRKYRIWRAVNTKGVTGMTDDSIGLPFEALWELQATGSTRTSTMRVPTANIGLRPSHRPARSKLWVSPTTIMLTCVLATAAPTGDLSVLSLNDNWTRAGLWLKQSQAAGSI